MIFSFVGGMLAFMALVISLNYIMDAKMIKLQIALVLAYVPLIAYSVYLIKYA